MTYTTHWVAAQHLPYCLCTSDESVDDAQDTQASAQQPVLPVLRPGESPLQWSQVRHTVSRPLTLPCHYLCAFCMLLQHEVCKSGTQSQCSTTAFVLLATYPYDAKQNSSVSQAHSTLPFHSPFSFGKNKGKK